MKHIFEQGDFNDYMDIRLDEAVKPVTEFYAKVGRTTVFISHKHDDLKDLMGLIGFLENKYHVKAYIDSRDPLMPNNTSGKTALRIKEKITQCNKFILLATNGAVESKWCNWELGFGDAKKFQDNIVLFPMKPKGGSDSLYKGNEYMSIYPYIVKQEYGDRYKNGSSVAAGYYVCTNEDGNCTLLPLEDWFSRR